jgi:hypothetical protein
MLYSYRVFTLARNGCSDWAKYAPDGYEVIGIKATYRLAQRPTAYVVLKYIRKVIKPKDEVNANPITPTAPINVLDKSFADASFFVGILIDKFYYHLPLYRQHRRLQQSKPFGRLPNFRIAS